MFVYGNVVMLKIGRYLPWKTVTVSSHLHMPVRPTLLHRMALVSFLLFRKNLSNLREFFGQIVYRPPWQKIARTPMTWPETSLCTVAPFPTDTSSPIFSEGSGRPYTGYLERIIHLQTVRRNWQIKSGGLFIQNSNYSIFKLRRNTYLTRIIKRITRLTRIIRL